jgi:hypothetical protein
LENMTSDHAIVGPEAKAPKPGVRFGNEKLASLGRELEQVCAAAFP